MAGIRELRGRIKSVGNIKQITRAMEMVATTKLRRFQDRAVASRPYADEIQALIRRLAKLVAGGEEKDATDRPLFKARDAVRTVGCLVVTSDRGLCGSYNSNILARVHRYLDAHPGVQPLFFVYGRKGYSYLVRRGFKVERFFVEPPLERLSYRDARVVAKVLVDAFLAEQVDEVVLFYTAFKSMTRHVPTVEPFLPLSTLGDDDAVPDGSERRSVDYILEPTPEVIFDRLVPRFLEIKVFNALMESVASEYASRRIAMKNATDAALDMANELQRTYNRVRQETITKQLLEIVGGAEALR